MTLEDDVAHLPELAATAIALATYAASLFPNARFVKKGRRWVCEPNFTSFEVRWQQRKAIVMTVRGLWWEFEKQDVLPVKRARGASYSECWITSPRQLAAAAVYLATAAALFRAGPRRPATRSSRLEL